MTYEALAQEAGFTGWVALDTATIELKLSARILPGEVNKTPCA